LEFVKDGGYSIPEFWSSTGAMWRGETNTKWPKFWYPKGAMGLHDYKLRTVFEMVELPLSWPVEVNKHEADAFAAWKTANSGSPDVFRIITEAEHNRLRDEITDDTKGRNTNLAFGSGTPVDLLEPTKSGHHDVFGNVWEWTADQFNPLPGFREHPFYSDFSTPCFDNVHNMIMGGSFMSTGGAGPSHYFRDHFRPHFLQHSGMRVVTSEEDMPAFAVNSLKQAVPYAGGALNDNVYETAELVEQNMVLHYGGVQQVFGDAGSASECELDLQSLLAPAVGFPQRCAARLAGAYQAHAEQHRHPTRVLDVGCAVGGATLALTRDFDVALGIDFSAAFIQKAKEIQSAPDAIEIQALLEGKVRAGDSTLATLDAGVRCANAEFREGDACNMDAEELGGPFDAVLMSNLICRVPDPAKVLADLSMANNGVGIVRRGGILMLVTPFSWNAQFTSEDKWLGGREGAEDSFQGLLEALGSNFQLLESFRMPLVIPDHKSRWQLISPVAATLKRID